MKNKIFPIYSFVKLETDDITSLDDMINKITNLGYERIIVDTTNFTIDKIHKLAGKYPYAIFRKHLSYSEKIRGKERRYVRKFVHEIIRDQKSNYCFIYSIDEEYASLLSPNDLRYFNIIRLYKFNYRTINRYIKHNFLFEIFLDQILRTLDKVYYVLPRIRILENANKTLVSQTRPLIRALIMPTVYYSIIGENKKSFKEIYLRINKVIENACENIP